MNTLPCLFSIDVSKKGPESVKYRFPTLNQINTREWPKLDGIRPKEGPIIIVSNEIMYLLIFSILSRKYGLMSKIANNKILFRVFVS